MAFQHESYESLKYYKFQSNGLELFAVYFTQRVCETHLMWIKEKEEQNEDQKLGEKIVTLKKKPAANEDL